jgi:hypothetical protein
MKYSLIQIMKQSVILINIFFSVVFIRHGGLGMYIEWKKIEFPKQYHI